MQTLTIYKQPNTNFFMSDFIIELPDCEISFDYDRGEYGLHDGFFNAVILINNKPYFFQCCTETDDFNDCGYDLGLCEKANQPLADLIGWHGVLAVIERDFKEFNQ